MDGFKFSDLVQRDKKHFVSYHEEYLATVDACVHAMEGGLLPVTSQQNRLFLWDFHVLTMDQLARVCVLLQQHRLPVSLLWTPKMGVLFLIKMRTAVGYVYVYKDPDTISALSTMEFLWQDLEAAEAWIADRKKRTAGGLTIGVVEWVTAEVDRRRQWSVGLRRAWLVASVV